MKCAYSNRDIWVIGGRNGARNPYIGWTVRATWLKPWGGKPAGYTVTGTLAATFCANGRTLIGEILTPDGRRVSAPWSQHYLSVEPLAPSMAIAETVPASIVGSGARRD